MANDDCAGPPTTAPARELRARSPRHLSGCPLYVQAKGFAVVVRGDAVVHDQMHGEVGRRIEEDVRVVVDFFDECEGRGLGEIW